MKQTPQLPPGAGVQAVSRHRMLWILAGFMFIVLVTGWLGFHARWHNPLNRYKAELRARGEKLTCAELAATETLGSGLTRTQLLSAASSLGQHSFSPGALDLMVYVQPGKARVAWAQDSPPWIAGDRPGAVHTWDEFIEQIQEAGQTLTVIRHLLTNPPTYWSPPPFSSSGSIPNFVPMRLSAEWLSGEAISSLRQGRLEDALRDIEAIATCAAIGRDSHSLVSQMIRVAVAGLGLSVTTSGAQHRLSLVKAAGQRQGYHKQDLGHRSAQPPGKV